MPEILTIIAIDKIDANAVLDQQIKARPAQKPRVLRRDLFDQANYAIEAAPSITGQSGTASGSDGVIQIYVIVVEFS